MLGTLFVMPVLTWFVLLVALGHYVTRPVKGASYTGFCQSCGYNLRRLPRDAAGRGTCSECGTAFDVHALKYGHVQRFARDRVRRRLAIVLALVCVIGQFVMDVVWLVSSICDGQRADLMIGMLRTSLAEVGNVNRCLITAATLIFLCVCIAKTSTFDGPRLVRMMVRCVVLWMLGISAWAVVMSQKYVLGWWTDEPVQGVGVSLSALLLLLCLFAVPAGLAARWLFGRAARSKPPTVPSANEQQARKEADA